MMQGAELSKDKQGIRGKGYSSIHYWWITDYPNYVELNARMHPQIRLVQKAASIAEEPQQKRIEIKTPWLFRHSDCFVNASPITRCIPGWR
jgi:hypothetical protein